MKSFTLGMADCVSFYVVDEKETISPRRTNANTVETISADHVNLEAVEQI